MSRGGEQVAGNSGGPAQAPANTPAPIVSAANDPLILWSTNPFLKHLVQKRYRHGRHFVWCSPVFSSEALASYAVGKGQPPSSDPQTIYRNTIAAVAKGD